MPEQFILFIILIIILLSIVFINVFTKFGIQIAKLQNKIIKELKDNKGEKK